VNILVRKPEGQRSLGRHVCIWEVDTNMELKEVDFDGVDWIELAQDRVHWWAGVNLWVSCGSF